MPFSFMPWLPEVPTNKIVKPVDVTRNLKNKNAYKARKQFWL